MGRRGVSDDDRIRAFAEKMKALYDTPMYGVLIRMWGENIHLGLFESADEDLHTGTERENERLAEGAALRPGQDVIEVGCGIGGPARYIARTRGVRVVATNISADQLRIAAERTEAAGLSHLVRFAHADFHDLPYADGRFDCWWCQAAMLHAVDKARVLREAWRVLKPGGRLVLTELVATGEMDPAARAAFDDIAHSPGMWRMAELDAALPAAGFEVLEREDWTNSAHIGWEKAREATEAMRAQFEPEVGKAPVDVTVERYRLWADVTRAGQVGWCYYAARKPMG